MAKSFLSSIFFFCKETPPPVYRPIIWPRPVTRPVRYPTQPYVFPQPTAIDLNYWKRISLSPTCPRCNMDFSSADERRTHYRKAHFDVYYGEQKCERRASAMPPIYRFMAQSFGDLDEERACTYGCKEATRYTSRFELAQHMEKKHLWTLQSLSLAFFKLIEEEADRQAQTADYAEMYNILSKVRPSQSVPPGDIATQPGTKIVFNAPFDDKYTYHIKVTNSSARRIGWTVKTTYMKRLGVDPAAGVLDPKKAVLIAVSCDAFVYGQYTVNDCVTIEWTNTPDGDAEQFRREWFQGDGKVRRKNLPIEYNP